MGPQEFLIANLEVDLLQGMLQHEHKDIQHDCLICELRFAKLF
jgi:hypothetical protein